MATNLHAFFARTAPLGYAIPGARSVPLQAPELEKEYKVLEEVDRQEKALLKKIKELNISDHGGTLTEFTCFENLPIELRIKIWENTIVSRTISGGAYHMSGGWTSKNRLIANPYTPAILHATQESRMVGLKSYEEIRSSQTKLRSKIYFNFELDTLFVCKYFGSWAHLGPEEFPKSLRSKVRYLAWEQQLFRYTVEHPAFIADDERMNKNKEGEEVTTIKTDEADDELEPEGDNLRSYKSLRSISIITNQLDSKTVDLSRPLHKLLPKLHLFDTSFQKPIYDKECAKWAAIFEQKKESQPSWTVPNLELSHLHVDWTGIPLYGQHFDLPNDLGKNRQRSSYRYY